MTPQRTFDLVVIGGGPGGYVAAIRASQLGMKTAVVERDALGGVCLNWGCIPTKALLKNAQVYNEFKHAADWGIACKDLTFDFAKIVARSRKVATINSKGVEYLMKKNKIEVFPGTGRLTGKDSIEVNKGGKVTDTIKTRFAILATGGRPRTIPGVIIDRKKVITSTEAMTLPELPKSLVVIGGGGDRDRVCVLLQCSRHQGDRRRDASLDPAKGGQGDHEDARVKPEETGYRDSHECESRICSRLK